MNRLTHKARYEAGYKLNKGVKEWQAADRLGAYEDTGLTPPEILELKERDTAKAVQKVDEQPYFRKHFHDYVCPVCHKKTELRWKFCGYCGQRLKKENDDAENT